MTDWLERLLDETPPEDGPNRFVGFTLRVARVPKGGDIVSPGCVHCGYPGDDTPDEGCPHGEHEYGKRYVLTPETAWETLTSLVGEARALAGIPNAATSGVWVEIEIPEEGD